MLNLTKKYRLVADEDKNIILSGEFDENTVTSTTQEYALEFSSEEEMMAKIEELGLTKTEEEATIE